MNNQKLISPRELYPTESFVFIRDDELQFYIKEFKMNKEHMVKPLVFYFENNYYILKGHHVVLAAAMINIEELVVEVVDRTQLSFWENDDNVKETLKSIGLSTLYDFETIGGFTYQSYPDYYKIKEEK
ncbi:hypothetical protein [[Clostridium] scindens]|uniref:hypothetical protein n=1 Tax=Clostridium scindens (strain JCM 10418 / VPI 12708) TaxID=29347 RepID=UPI003AB80241